MPAGHCEVPDSDKKDWGSNIIITAFFVASFCKGPKAF